MLATVPHLNAQHQDDGVGQPYSGVAQGSIQPSSPQDHIDDASLVIKALVESRGNSKLALDYLHHEHGLLLTNVELVNIIKDHMSDLKSQMEVVATLELFSLMPQIHKTL